MVRDMCGTLVKSGLRNLDYVIGGDWLPGIVFFGAVSGAGKTTLALNMAWDSALRQQPVLFFSLEMDERSTYAKLLSKNTYEICDGACGLDESRAWTSSEVVRFLIGRDYPEKDMDVLRDAQIRMLLGLPHFRIITPDKMGGSVTAQDIADIVDEFVRLYGCKPVVFVDYLQILSSVQRKDDARGAVEDSVRRLRECCIRNGITMFVISSINRASYTAKIEEDGFKESGCIEYSADYLFTINFVDVMERENSMTESEKRYKDKIIKDGIDSAKSKRKRLLSVNILKNRFGKPGGAAFLEFDAASGVFREVVGDEAAKVRERLYAIPKSKEKQKKQE